MNRALRLSLFSILSLAMLLSCSPVPSAPAAGVVSGTDTATATMIATMMPAATPVPPAMPYAFASDYDGDGEIYWVERDGQVRKLTDNNAPDWDPIVERSGKRIAFTSRRDGNSEIYVLDLDSGESRNVTKNPAADYEADWSPDGSHLVFVSERDGTRDLYTLDLAHDITRRLTFSGWGEAHHSPAWSPDGVSIAYSAVRAGVEHVYVLELGGGERQITEWPLKGKYPCWSEDGQQIAFAGWHEDDKPGVYLAPAIGGAPQWLWEGRSAIRNLAWAGNSILFSAASADDSYDLKRLDLITGIVTDLAGSKGWDDCPSIIGAGYLPIVAITSPGGDATSEQVVPVVLGANVADLSNSFLLHELGFTWFKNYLSWAGVEPEKGQFYWEDSDNIVETAERTGLKVLLRLHDTPEWARPPDTTTTHPPASLNDYRDFIAAVASRYKGRVAAYEIGNEPNLYFEWGMQEPDPAAYVAMLKVAYETIKANDPEALVVSGGLATTGDGGEAAIGDLHFLRGMYEAGAKGYFDVLGSHPYGYGSPPFALHPYGLSVSRLVQQRDIMKAYGDEGKPIWATEVGWVLTSPWSLGEHEQFTVSEFEQALYIKQLCLLAGRKWPWLEGIFLFNLDFSTVSWYDSPQPMRWYSLLEGDGSPRLSFTWLRGIGRVQNH